MEKMKQLFEYCSLCKKTVNIMIPADLAMDKDLFPFAYINVHGSPEHALMLFLDANLSIRSSMICEDIKIAKEKGNELMRNHMEDRFNGMVNPRNSFK